MRNKEYPPDMLSKQKWLSKLTRRLVLSLSGKMCSKIVASISTLFTEIILENLDRELFWF